MKNIPIEIKRVPNEGIQIGWKSGTTQTLSARVLRVNCPCATCREARGDQSHAAPLTTAKPSMLRVIESSSDEETRLVKIWAVGNYALGMEWGDGHSTGIYTYEYLRGLDLMNNNS